MKILIVADTFPPNVNGAAMATYKMAQELRKRGNSIFVIAPSTSFRNYTKEEDGLIVYRLRSILLQKTQDFRMSFPVLHAREISKIITKIHPDIIHVNNPGFLAQSAIGVARKLHIPIIGTSHFMPENLVHYLRLPDPVEDVVNRIVWREYARIYSKLDTIISPTPTAAKLLTRFPSIKKVEVISNGINIEKFRNNKNDGTYLKKRYHLPNDPILLFVGRIDKEKNIDIFIEAMGILKERNHAFSGLIVGKGKELASLKQLTKRLHLTNLVTFTGYIGDEDLLSIYKIADIFVMPSIAELQSLVTMDAMANKLPVVAANAVALPHLVKNGVNGFLFVPGNPYDLADKLEKVLLNSSMRREMAEESWKMIQEHDINHVMAKLENVYKTVIKQYTLLHQKIA